MMVDFIAGIHLRDWPVTVKPASFSILIDWLGGVHDTTANRKIGTLVCQDDRGYVCRIHGDLRTFDPSLVQIQIVQSGPYNPGSAV